MATITDNKSNKQRQMTKVTIPYFLH